MIAIVIGLLLLFALLGMPIAVAVGLATVVAALGGDVPVERLPQTIVTTLTNFPLLAIPLFVMAGKIMEVTGISRNLITFAYGLVGHIKGGLAYVSILALVLFGAISGSSTAATVAIGAILIPAMVKQGFDRPFAASLQGAGGIVSGTIPPSIPLILYGVVAGVSVGDLFIAGIIPGLLVALALAGAVWFALKRKGPRNPAPELVSVPRGSLRDLAVDFVKAIPSLMMPAIILGGIYSGFFTPTEAGAVACLYGVIVGILYRSLKIKDVGTILTSTVSISSVLLFVMATAAYFGSWLTIERIPQQLTSFLSSMNMPWVITWLLILLVLIIIGMFMEASAALIIMVPILLPVATGMGMDPVHFGVIMITVLSLGLLTPPVGMALFVSSKVGEVSVESVIRPSLYFAIAIFAVILLLLFIPQLSLVLL